MRYIQLLLPKFQAFCRQQQLVEVPAANMLRSSRLSVQLLLFLLPAILFHVSAASVCSNGLYAVFAPLSAVPQVQQFCTSDFPVYVTSTSTVITTATVTGVSATKKRRREASALIVTTKTSKSSSSTKTTLTTSNKATNAAPSLALLQAQAKSFLTTFCSCIESPKTISTTVTSTSTTTVAPAASCLAPGVVGLS